MLEEQVKALVALPAGVASQLLLLGQLGRVHVAAVVGQVVKARLAAYGAGGHGLGDAGVQAALEARLEARGLEGTEVGVLLLALAALQNPGLLLCSQVRVQVAQAMENGGF